MKNQLSSFLSLLFVLSTLSLRAQTDAPKCDNERYQNAKLSEDEFKDFNASLDDACKEINKGNYAKAINFLEAAYQKKDAEFVNQEIQKLREYLDELSTNPAKKEDPVTPEKQQEQPVVAREAPVEKKQEEKKADENPVEQQVESTDTKIPPPSETTLQSQPETKVAEPTPPSQPETATKTETKMTEPEKENIDAGNTQSGEVTEPAAPETKMVETTISAEQSATPASTQAEDNSDDAVVKTFSDEQKTEFQRKGLAKVRQFEQYINTICSKQTSAEMASQITDNALELFYNPDDNYVEVSSKNRPGKRRLKVQNYLEKLRLLNYDNVIIEWAELNYASDFIKAEDGTYRAYIITRQRFTAMKDNTVNYEDVVTKRIEITITQYQKAIDGVLIDSYDVFLGDISVDHTE